MKIQLKFKPQDLWVGVYFERCIINTSIYICLIPCFPIKISWVRTMKTDWSGVDANVLRKNIDEDIENYAGDYFADSAFHEDCGDR